MPSPSGSLIDDASHHGCQLSGHPSACWKLPATVATTPAARVVRAGASALNRTKSMRMLLRAARTRRPAAIAETSTLMGTRECDALPPRRPVLDLTLSTIVVGSGVVSENARQHTSARQDLVDYRSFRTNVR